ncbi:MAG: hypothetical protein ACLUUO_02570 [Sellimonas intestinalis]
MLDEACSKAALRGYKMPEQIEDLEQIIGELNQELEDAIKAEKYGEGCHPCRQTKIRC